jgi:hypothetical protein
MEYRAFEPSQGGQPAFGEFQLKILEVMLAQRQISEEVVTAALRVWI